MESEYVTVPKQFKTNEFQNGMFLKPSIYYKHDHEVLFVNLRYSLLFLHVIVRDRVSQPKLREYWDCERKNIATFVEFLFLKEIYRLKTLH